MPPELLADDLALACVHAAPKIEAELANGVDDRPRAHDRPRRTVEARQESVACVGRSRGRESDRGECARARDGGRASSAQARSPSSDARSVDPTRSVTSTVARTRSGHGSGRRSPERVDASRATRCRWRRRRPSGRCSAGLAARRVSRPAMWRAKYSPGPRSPGLDSTTVGTRTTGRTSATSDSMVIRKNASADPGLRLRRMCARNHARNAGSSSWSGDHSARRASRNSVRPQPSRTSAQPCAPLVLAQRPRVVVAAQSLRRRVEQDRGLRPVRDASPRTASRGARPPARSTGPRSRIPRRPSPRADRPCASRASGPRAPGRTIPCRACRSGSRARKSANASTKRTSSGCSQTDRMSPAKPRTNTRSAGPSPTTW